MNLGQGQDWNDVVLSKRHTGAAASASKNVRATQQSGAQVDTAKKFAAGGNSQATTGTGVSAKKLEEETEDFSNVPRRWRTTTLGQERVAEHGCAVARVPTELKKQILQARLAKKLTQAQLAQAVNEKPNVIQEYESGKAIPNPAILQKMSRVLGVPLSKTGGGGKAAAAKPAAKTAAPAKKKKNPQF